MSVLWGLCVWLFACSPVGLAQDRFVEAKQLVRTVYPETAGQHLYINMRVDGTLDSPGPLSSFDLYLEKADAPDAKGESQLGCVFNFPVLGDLRIMKMACTGAVVNLQKNEQLRKLVDDHPEWNDQEVLSAMGAAGVRYGPNAESEFVKQLPLKSLESFIGKVHVSSVRFDLRSKPQMEEHQASAELQWVVVADAIGRNGKTVRYFMGFEPFEGKLLDFFRLL